MEPTGNYDWIADAIREHHLDERDFGLFMSLVTDRDTDIAEVPAFARACSFQRVGGWLEFSFTCVGPDDPPTP